MERTGVFLKDVIFVVNPDWRIRYLRLRNLTKKKKKWSLLKKSEFSCIVFKISYTTSAKNGVFIQCFGMS